MDEEELAVDYGEMREKVHAALTQIIGEEETEDTILSGWSLIFEGIHQDNRRSLTFLTSDATGESPLTPWAARGFMDHVQLFLFDPGGIEEDEEED